MVDTIALLAHAQANITQLRKEQIKPALKKEYATICHLEDQPDSKLLFGDDLPKSLKEAKEASNLSSSMKGYSPKPYFASKKPSGSKSYQGYNHGSKDFLWQGPHRNTQIKKKPVRGRKDRK